MIHTLSICACIALTCFLDILFIVLLCMIDAHLLRSSIWQSGPSEGPKHSRLRRLDSLRKSKSLMNELLSRNSKLVSLAYCITVLLIFRISEPQTLQLCQSRACGMSSRERLCIAAVLQVRKT